MEFFNGESFTLRTQFIGSMTGLLLELEEVHNDYYGEQLPDLKPPDLQDRQVKIVQRGSLETVVGQIYGVGMTGLTILQSGSGASIKTAFSDITSITFNYNQKQEQEMDLFNGKENIRIGISNNKHKSGLLNKIRCIHKEEGGSCHIKERHICGQTVFIRGHNFRIKNGIITGISYSTLTVDSDIGEEVLSIDKIDYIIFNYSELHSAWLDEANKISKEISKELRKPAAEEVTVFANATESTPDSERTVTLCGKYELNENSDKVTVFVGWAVCHPLDEFDWSLARKISSNRVRSRNPVGSIRIRRRGRSDEELREDIHSMLEAHAEYHLRSGHLWNS